MSNTKDIEQLLSSPLVEAALEMILYFTESGTVIYGNSAACTLLNYDTLQGLSITDIFPNSFHEENNLIATDVPFDSSMVTMMAYRKNNTCFRVEAKFAKSPMYQGACICLAVDVSKMEALEKQIEGLKENTTDLNRVKNEFVANVTHELRTPVNGILGNTRELISRTQSEEDLKILNMIERGCEDMNALINNILDFSKLDAGKFQLEPREFEFRKMIEYVRSNHVNKIHEKGLDLFITVSPDTPEKLIGDELRIVQILNNLLSNATKFTSVGKIMMEAVPTSRVGNRIEIFFMVMDTGIGIDKKNQDKLFKSFSQVEASISRRFGGTGLGLNISKQLVELMGGHISVESELGKGTTFTFSIWLDVPGTNAEDASMDYTGTQPVFSITRDEAEASRAFGSPENISEINKRLMKLSLSVDMDAWEKSEMFMDAIKQLSDGAPREISSAILRLKMAVQKENKTKAKEAIDTVTEALAQFG